jgi:hypothetical protein
MFSPRHPDEVCAEMLRDAESKGVCMLNGKEPEPAITPLERLESRDLVRAHKYRGNPFNPFH